MSPITEELEPAGSSPASEQPGSERQAATAAHQPPAQQRPSGDILSADSADDEQVPAGQAAVTEDEVAVLQQALEAKLHLAEPLQELPSLSGSTASVEDLTPLQQLLLMCGQEVRGSGETGRPWVGQVHGACRGKQKRGQVVLCGGWVANVHSAWNGQNGWMDRVA